MAKNYYDILELDENATKQEIDAAFLKKKQANEKLNNQIALAELQEAYDCLSDEEAREQYDLTLKPAPERIAQFILAPDTHPRPRSAIEEDFVEDRGLLNRNPKLKEEFEEVNWLIRSNQWGENVKATPGLYNGQPIILLTITYTNKAELDNVLETFKKKGFELKELPKKQPQNQVNNNLTPQPLQPSPTSSPRPWPPVPKPTPKDPTQL